jgi:hypothetical protein
VLLELNLALLGLFNSNGEQMVVMPVQVDINAKKKELHSQLFVLQALTDLL